MKSESVRMEKIAIGAPKEFAICRGVDFTAVKQSERGSGAAEAILQDRIK
jgi:hypothetical protein